MITGNLVLAMIASGALVVLVFVIKFFLDKPDQPNFNHSNYQKQWRAIMEQKESQASWNLAVINADKLLDKALLDWQFKGDTMGKRLIEAKPRLKEIYQDTWRAHKLRNQLVHEVDSEASRKQIEAAVKTFYRALIRLGVKL